MGAGEGGQGGSRPGYRPSRAGMGPVWTTVHPIRAARRATPPPMAEPPLVDPARLRALRADYGAVAAELVDVYETTAAGTVGELRAALAADDGEEVRRLAHRLKGSARNVGATGMAELAAALEAGPADAAAAHRPARGAPSTRPAPRCARRARRLTPGRSDPGRDRLLEDLADPAVVVEHARADEALRARTRPTSDGAPAQQSTRRTGTPASAASASAWRTSRPPMSSPACAREEIRSST